MEDNDWIKHVKLLIVEGIELVGRPRKTWDKVQKKILEIKGIH